MDQIIIAFFFLLRPGEHSYDKKENHPFRLQDVSFQTPAGTTNAATISDAELALATKVHHQFTNQKNGIKREHITHGDNTKELAAVSIKSDPSTSPTPTNQQCPSGNSSTHCISREWYHQTCSSCQYHQPITTQL
jgi:hypothetical protein